VLRRILLLFSRALTLRCPHCGGRPLLVSWFKMRESCPRCGLRVERGERDYFLGSMMFNLVVAELLFTAVVVTVLIATWPDVPWRLLQYGGPALMVLAPLALFPFSKTIWLAFDLMLRPVTPEELAWHRERGEEGDRVLPMR
jgi:uncharacterized protein (DUF983 family)